MIYKGVRTCSSQNVKGWRKWLESNFHVEKSVWLILHHPNDDKSGITYDEAIEEAMCFGWVDCKSNKRDQDSYYLFFAKRNAKSNWTKKERKIVDQLIKNNKMHEAGLEVVRVAKENGTWSAIDDITNRIIPEDLQSEFDENQRAFQNYLNFSPSAQKSILKWIYNAKKASTREKRIEETVELAERNIRANACKKEEIDIYNII